MLADLQQLGLWPTLFLDLDSAFILLITSLFTSAMTAAFGLGGGVIMLAALVNFLPVAYVIPIHGVIQASSNLSRAALLRAFIDWNIIRYYLLGAVFGALIGGQFVVSLPESVLLSIVGLFILYVVWGPKPKQFKADRYSYMFGLLLVRCLLARLGHWLWHCCRESRCNLSRCQQRMAL